MRIWKKPLSCLVNLAKLTLRRDLGKQKCCRHWDLGYIKPHCCLGWCNSSARRKGCTVNKHRGSKLRDCGQCYSLLSSTLYLRHFSKRLDIFFCVTHFGLDTVKPAGCLLPSGPSSRREVRPRTLSMAGCLCSADLQEKPYGATVPRRRPESMGRWTRALQTDGLRSPTNLSCLTMAVWLNWWMSSTVECGSHVSPTHPLGGWDLLNNQTSSWSQ